MLEVLRLAHVNSEFESRVSVRPSFPLSHTLALRFKTLIPSHARVGWPRELVLGKTREKPFFATGVFLFVFQHHILVRPARDLLRRAVRKPFQNYISLAILGFYVRQA